MKSFSESDWKVFREKIVVWQENYIAKTNEKIIKVLSDQNLVASDRFWKAEKMIAREKKKTSVVAEMTRSKMVYNILSMIKEKSITIEDLTDFSEDFQEHIKSILID